MLREFCSCGERDGIKVTGAVLSPEALKGQAVCCAAAPGRMWGGPERATLQAEAGSQVHGVHQMPACLYRLLLKRTGMETTLSPFLKEPGYK